MKPNIATILLLLFFTACTTHVSEKNAEIHFSKSSHNFGKLEYKKYQDVTFEFDNPGENPLLILNVKTSCGCTVPKWTKKPVKPGGKGSIDITYESDFPGRFRKTITVFYNGKNSPDTLQINGEVEFPEELEELSHREHRGDTESHG